MGLSKLVPSRKTVAKTAGWFGGMYLANGYIQQRLQDAREALERDRQAQENLTRRFDHTQDTSSYTVLALLPELSAQILGEMDVEGITKELQARSRARVQPSYGAVAASAPAPTASASPVPASASATQASTTPAQAQATLEPPLERAARPTTSCTGTSNDRTPSLASSIDMIHDSDLASSTSASDSLVSGSLDSTPASSQAQGFLGEKGVDASDVGKGVHVDGVVSGVLNGDGDREHEQGQQKGEQRETPQDAMSSSFSSVGSTTSLSEESAVRVDLSESIQSSLGFSSLSASELSTGSPLADPRTKAELWNEVKILTLTRTLTTLYSLTLLTLLTNLQLTILARGKYVLAVFDEEREEEVRRRVEERFGSGLGEVGALVGGMVWGGVKDRVGGVLRGCGVDLGALVGGGGLEEDFEKLLTGLTDPRLDQSRDNDEDVEEKKKREAGERFRLEEETENKYLTLSWWVLHVGWKDVGERVRRGVEEVFDGGFEKGLGYGGLVCGEFRCGVGCECGFAVSRERERAGLSWSVLSGLPVMTSQGGTGPDGMGASALVDLELERRRWLEDMDIVSLKTKLSAQDLHRLVGDVRRRVEYEVTFEGRERRVDFLSSLLPSTPETIHHVLVQGGFTPPPNPTAHPADTATQDATDDSTLSSSQLSTSNHSFVEYFGRDGFNDDEDKEGSAGNDTPPPPATLHGRPDLVHSSLDGADGVQESARPDPYPHISGDKAFCALVDETRDVVRGVEFGVVVERCLDRAVEVLFDGLERNVFVEGGNAQGQAKGKGKGKAVDRGASIVEVADGQELQLQEEEEEVRIRLAGLLPGLARWSQLALDGLPNELVDNLLATYEVGSLSAIVFGRFEEWLR
ncbi:hypothetical protein FA15DRAFT_696488 [Coprinopsis marcescibilis]|uniref:Peroxin-3 n=1 Tax=Coprinopsis marcescibilis TaxID=230819 RepID=A0A5C3KM03_COPMA|nr:hypothetical protein FA15DRAFT_696488 [Coprinopsis marcescibilis]